MSVAQPLVIVGAGGFGREVLDIVDAINSNGMVWKVLGFVDDGAVNTEVLTRRGARFLGSTGMLDGLHAAYVIGIGNGLIRERLAMRASAYGLEAGTLVHPMATIGGDCRIGAGVIIAAGGRVSTNVTLGDHVNLHVNCTVGHDANLGDFASVLPGATIGGAVDLGVRASVGTGANVLQGLTIGDSAFVGAGSVVTRSVPRATTVAGVPAAPIGPSEKLTPSASPADEGSPNRRVSL